jgi:hypothetical protein
MGLETVNRLNRLFSGSLVSNIEPTMFAAVALGHYLGLVCFLQAVDEAQTLVQLIACRSSDLRSSCSFQWPLRFAPHSQLCSRDATTCSRILTSPRNRSDSVIKTLLPSTFHSLRSNAHNSPTS